MADPFPTQKRLRDDKPCRIDACAIRRMIPKALICASSNPSPKHSWLPGETSAVQALGVPDFCVPGVSFGASLGREAPRSERLGFFLA